MRASLSQSFMFESAHTLERTVPLEHHEPSTRVHGHTYTAVVAVAGELGPSGMIEFKRKGFKGIVRIDLYELRKAIGEVRAMLDHRYLNEVVGLGVPTLESLCVYIANSIKAHHLPLAYVEVSRATGDACRIEAS